MNITKKCQPAVEQKSIITKHDKETLEKTKGVIKNGKSRETGNIGYTRHKTMTNK